MPRRTLAVITILVLIFVQTAPTTAAAPRPDVTRCLSAKPPFGPPADVSVALVKPTFTSTPYSDYDDGSFYAFFHRHVRDSVVTTDLGLLKTPVSEAKDYNEGWGQDYDVYSFFKYGDQRGNPGGCGLGLGFNVSVVDDIGVNDGVLFTQAGARVFDSVIIGHEEYVTQAEYDQFQRFVATGGRLIELSGNGFFAKVNYSRGVETLVSGHGWVFDGKEAVASSYQPFWESNINWFGSNYLGKVVVPNVAQVNRDDPIGAKLYETFGENITQSYMGRLEVNELQNLTHSSVIASWAPAIKSYVHQYGRGLVICLCVYSEGNSFSDLSFQYFMINAVLDDVPPVTPLPQAASGLHRIGPMICSTTVCFPPRGWERIS